MQERSDEIKLAMANPGPMGSTSTKIFEKQLLKVSEAIAFFPPAERKLGRLYAAVRAGEIPAGVVVFLTSTSKGIRFHRKHLLAWLSSRRQLLDAKQTAELLGCSRHQVYLNADPVEGIFPESVVVRKNGRLFFDRRALEDWLEAGGHRAA